MSNDTALAKQVNTLLSGHRVYEKVDDEQSIAKVLRNGKIASDVKIESQKYDMDIFYNESKEKFELMSNQEGTSQHYKTLRYYLNLQESEEITPPEEPEVEDNTVIFFVNEEYIKEFDDFYNVSNNIVTTNALVDNGEIYINIAIDESSNIIKKVPKIDLGDIITALDSAGNPLEISYNCVPVDPVEEVSPNGNNYFHLDGSDLEVYTPGIYAITASYEDKTFSIDLFVKNIF